ncbi:MAG: alcohol dehydrogenase catalytic domain-containing protein [Acidobacteria bacterium]|nr:alcohol dehydrogenase catalytic domain-containing protein [Acidobacteriota bacterium]MBI3663078.1 alcohol dehydrogenase catalytic domain-containing protein [Acidobacteriota bacterium]
MLSFIVQNGKLQRQEKIVPTLKPGWALARVRLAGICNTDIEILRGYHDFHGTPGHEFVGEVVECADRTWIGGRVVGEINIACKGLGRQATCGTCRRGNPTHCEHRRVLGIIAHNGAFAEYLTLPVCNLHKVPDEVSDERAVFTEPLAAACEILEQVDVSEHEAVAVLGDGKLAQLIARVLRAAGPRVTMFGKHADKLALARKAGIATIKVTREGRGALKAKKRWTMAVEATGSPEGLQQALAMLAPRGTLVLKSTFHGAAQVETWPIVVKEINVIGSRCGPFRPALAMLRSGKVDPRALISRTFPLGEAAAAIRYAQEPGVLKVLLKP